MADDPTLDRAAEARGLEVQCLHEGGEFPFDAAMRDIATTTDRATAAWVAKTLEYPVPADLAGTAWPWALTAAAVVAAQALGARLVRVHQR